MSVLPPVPGEILRTIAFSVNSGEEIGQRGQCVHSSCQGIGVNELGKTQSALFLREIQQIFDKWDVINGGAPAIFSAGCFAELCHRNLA